MVCQGWRELYIEHKRLLQDRAWQLDRLMLAIDADGRRALDVARSPDQAEGSPMARVVKDALRRASVGTPRQLAPLSIPGCRASGLHYFRKDRPDETFDGVLLGSHTYMTLKSAAQYEIKGVPIAQLNNQPLKVRYNVFPPTRYVYLQRLHSFMSHPAHHVPTGKTTCPCLPMHCRRAAPTTLRLVKCGIASRSAREQEYSASS
jgi:hypothetical protein